VWILFCLLATRFLLETTSDSLSVAKDRLVTEDIPEIVFSANCSHLLSSLLTSLPSSSHSVEMENACGCLIDAVFHFYSLLSVASVSLSPLQQRCLEIESTDSSFEATVPHSNQFGEVFPLALAQFRSTFLLNFFKYFIENSLLSKLPSLSLAFLDHLPVWGSHFNSLLLVSSPPALYLKATQGGGEVVDVNQFSDCLISTAIVGKPSSSTLRSISLVSYLSSPLS
jgi:hypothetical protein